jgi:sugar-phosphatase
VLGVATSHPAHDLTAAHVVVPDLAACIVEVTVEGLVISTAG